MLLDRLSRYEIYLASRSPRRHALLKGMGVDFTYLPVEVEEEYPGDLPPAQVAEYLSRLKLSPVRYLDYPPEALFIACDTLVVLEGDLIGKPASKEDARQILRRLSGKEHTVVSGLSVAKGEKMLTAHQETLVKFKPLAEEEITYYVDHYAPLDKAGAYGIQEWIGYVAIEYVEGSFYNIMGLPTKLLWDMLEEILEECPS